MSINAASWLVQIGTSLAAGVTYVLAYTHSPWALLPGVLCLGGITALSFMARWK